MTAPREIQIVLMNLADDCWGSDTNLMHAGFLAACETYGVNPGRCDECGEHDHVYGCIANLCVCGNDPRNCTCDALYDERMGK